MSADEAPANEDLLAEGRAAICTALDELAEQARKPKLAAFLRTLRAEVAASDDAGGWPKGRANYVFRIADDYYRRRWDAISADPPAYPESVNAIGRMYRARRVSYEWRFPGKWQVALTM